MKIIAELLKIFSVFIKNISDRYHVVSLPVNSGEWCNAGASTNLETYSSWIQRTIEYLDSSFADTVTDDIQTRVKQIKQTAVVVKEQVEDEVDKDNTCSSNPCGAHALCWNGDGSSYLCTCMPDYPHGNPYIGCGKCQYDSQCGAGQQCKDQECEANNGVSGDGVLDAGYQVPPEYVQVAGEQYYISQKPMSWSQAQYNCMSREGERTMIFFSHPIKYFSL